MRDISTKITGDTLTADEFNDVPTEIENAILACGIALSSSDLYQLSKAISHYVAIGSFYSSTGTNNYTLSLVGSKDSPDSYYNGMIVRCIIPNGNTGAVTINVNSLGSKSVGLDNGLTPLASGVLPSGYAEFVYISSNNAFDLRSIYKSTTTRKGIVELATDAETISGIDAERAVTPSGVAALLASHVFPSGTKMVFYQAAAPIGWTIDAAVNDRAIVALSGAGGTTGGSWVISGLGVGGHALTTNQIPPHTHIIPGYLLSSGGTAVDSVPTPGGLVVDANNSTQSAGGGQPHNHSLSSSGSWRPSYAAVIVCTKD